jgi:hypothetical protein
MARSAIKLAIAAAVAATALCAQPAAAAGRIWGFFVGIDHYKWSKQHYAHADDEFVDLAGGRRDVELIRGALSSKYGLGFGQGCNLSPTNRGCTLLDDQADARSIRTRLEELIYDRAAPGDTVVFYYSGHGSQLSDDKMHNQAGGANDTLVPYDGHGPDHVPDILDADLGTLINWANAHGVSVVTIFDSCNSGTATRDAMLLRVRKRSAPAQSDAASVAAAHATALWRNPPDRPSAAAGYRVHIAAAADGSSALEAEIKGEWRGLFTNAFAGALTELPRGARYIDLVSDAELKLQQSGIEANPSADMQQYPTAEADLGRNFLGAEASDARIYQAHAVGGGAYDVEGGTLSGVTPGSKFDMYADYTAAADKKAAPLASGHIAPGAGVATARFVADTAVDAPADGASMEQAYLRETEHAYGDLTLKVGLRSKDPQLAKAIKGLAVTIVDADPQIWLDHKDGRFIVQQRSGDAIIAYPDDGQGPARLQSTLKAIASYQGVLQVADSAQRPPLELRMYEGGCGSTLPPTMVGGEPVLTPGDGVHFVISNLDAKTTYYFYLLDLNAYYKVDVIFPPDHSTSDAIAPGEKNRCVQFGQQPFPVSFPSRPQAFGPATAATEPLREYIVLIASDAPVPLDSLMQCGLRTRSFGENPLNTLLANVNQGARDVTPPIGVTSWGASVLSLKIKPGPQGVSQLCNGR